MTSEEMEYCDYCGELRLCHNGLCTRCEDAVSIQNEYDAGYDYDRVDEDPWERYH